MKLLTRVLKRIRYMYWDLIPYKYRPGQLWYKLICRLWRRYTVIKSRYLPYTWVDRCDLLPETMFEILSQFIEKECSPGTVQWYGEHGHKIVVNGTAKFVRDEMQYLYDWWHDTYKVDYDKAEEQLCEKSKLHHPDRIFIPIDEEGNETDEENASWFEYCPQFKNCEDKEMYNAALDTLYALEVTKEKELDEMLHRLINIRPYLWT